MADTKVEEIGTAFHQFKATHDAALAAERDGNKARHAELMESVKKINDRMDEVETAVSRPRFATVGDREESSDPIEREHDAAHRKAFNILCRKGHNFLSETDRKVLSTRVHTDPVTGVKSLASDNLTTGGYLLPRNINMNIIELLAEMSVMRQVADVVTITSGDSDEQPKEGTTAFATGWQGERETPAETAAGTFEMDKIPVHFQYAKPLVTQKMLDDAMFDIEAYVGKKVAERMGIAEGATFITGTGVGRPLGVTMTLPGTTAITTVASGVSASLDTDSILSLFASLKSFYAKAASLLMSRATKYTVRKLKAGDGHYLWQPSLQIGTPSSFDGVPVFEDPEVAALGANAKSVIYGDFKRGYRVVDRQGIEIRPDPFTSKPHTEMYTTRRVGGQVVLPEALRILVCDA